MGGDGLLYSLRRVLLRRVVAIRCLQLLEASLHFRKKPPAPISKGPRVQTRRCSQRHTSVEESLLSVEESAFPMVTIKICIQNWSVLYTNLDCNQLFSSNRPKEGSGQQATYAMYGGSLPVLIHISSCFRMKSIIVQQRITIVQHSFMIVQHKMTSIPRHVSTKPIITRTTHPCRWSR